MYWPLADGALEGGKAVFGDVGLNAPVGSLPCRPVPVGGQEKRVDRVVVRLVRIVPVVIDEVAVEIDVVFVDPAAMSEAVRVHRMDQDAGSSPRAVRATNALAQKADLAAGAQEAFHPVGRRGDDVEQLGILRPEPRDISVERARRRARWRWGSVDE